MSAERMAGFTETIELLVGAGARVEFDFPEAAAIQEMGDLLRVAIRETAGSPRHGG